jgi:nicotinate-nucleotide--dimethylbenzimidazole phosphoribosyltransferase
MPHGNSVGAIVGAGSGLSSEGVQRKYSVLKQSLERYTGNGAAEDVMCYFGGLEMVMAVGAMLQAGTEYGYFGGWFHYD